MITHEVTLGKWDWTIVAFYDTTANDAGEVLKILERLGCRGRYLSNARRNLLMGLPNTGLTYTSEDYRTSVMVIGRSTSPAEFANTFDHEKGHVSEHIAEILGIDHMSEEMEYLRGAIAERLYPIAIRFLCRDRCYS